MPATNSTRVHYIAGTTLPANTVLVAGNSRWANPAKVSNDPALGWIVTFQDEITVCANEEEAHEYAVFIYNGIYNRYKHGGSLEDLYYTSMVIDTVLSELEGKHLADYTPLHLPSNVDVLLNLMK